jgi:hypothetical protein
VLATPFAGICGGCSGEYNDLIYRMMLVPSDPTLPDDFLYCDPEGFIYSAFQRTIHPLKIKDWPAALVGPQEGMYYCLERWDGLIPFASDKRHIVLRIYKVDPQRPVPSRHVSAVRTGSRSA